MNMLCQEWYAKRWLVTVFHTKFWTTLKWTSMQISHKAQELWWFSFTGKCYGRTDSLSYYNSDQKGRAIAILMLQFWIFQPYSIVANDGGMVMIYIFHAQLTCACAWNGFLHKYKYTNKCDNFSAQTRRQSRLSWSYILKCQQLLAF